MNKISDSMAEKCCRDSVYVMYGLLKDLCINNAEFYKNDKSSTGIRLLASFEALLNNVNIICPIVDEIRKVAPTYDFNNEIPGNGYRSFVTIVDGFILYSGKICQYIFKNKSSYFFRKSTYLREVEICNQALSALSVILSRLKILITWSDAGSLFPCDDKSPLELLNDNGNDSERFNQICFYGRCLGLQFCKSMQVLLKGLSILMVSFSEVYYSDGGVLESATNYLWHSSKYVLNSELRARRIVHLSQYASVDFCKKFWFLAESELVVRLPHLFYPSVEVNRLIYIPPEPLTSPKADGGLVDIPIPSAQCGPATLSVRLISAVCRQHMVGKSAAETSTCQVPPSRGLIFHCHGGGFVAQSSRSHEAYLRQWAQGLPAPILSVDYSLAPEAPFPRALEEALYAYCWALNHTSLLGTTGERIVFAGDSSGANLMIGVTMKCIELGLRPPDALFLAYMPVVISMVPSPGRLLTLMDPLVPFGFLVRCLKAYACPPDLHATSTDNESKLRRSKNHKESTKGNTKSLLSSEENNTLEQCSDADHDPLQETMILPMPLEMLNFEVPRDPYLSPYWASDAVLSQFPPTHITTLQMDPFIDDCVEFAKKLKRLGNPVTLDIIDGLPHGFLNTVMLNKEAHEASKKCMQKIAELLALDSKSYS